VKSFSLYWISHRLWFKLSTLAWLIVSLASIRSYTGSMRFFFAQRVELFFSSSDDVYYSVEDRLLRPATLCSSLTPCPTSYALLYVAPNYSDGSPRSWLHLFFPAPKNHFTRTIGEYSRPNYGDFTPTLSLAGLPRNISSIPAHTRYHIAPPPPPPPWLVTSVALIPFSLEPQGPKVFSRKTSFDLMLFCARQRAVWDPFLGVPHALPCFARLPLSSLFPEIFTLLSLGPPTGPTPSRAFVLDVLPYPSPPLPVVYVHLGRSLAKSRVPMNLVFAERPAFLSCLLFSSYVRSPPKAPAVFFP